MVRRISVICAPPHENPGMYSVDLAFDRWLAGSGLAATAQRYCVGGPHVATGLERTTLEYASLEERFEEVLASDLILYWGDYHHALSYWRTALRVRPDRAARAADQAADAAHLARHLLLAGQPQPVLDKTLSFGTTLLGDDLRAITTIESPYREAFPAFVRGARRLWFRDPLSAARAGALRGDPSRSHLSVDCAQLLSRADYRALADAEPSDSTTAYACVHFGRSPGPLEPAARLTELLVRRAGLAAVWLPWLGSGAGAVPDSFGRHVARLEADPTPWSYERLIARLAGARLVVTDTYHLCVIAWSLGIPAICVGGGAQHAVRPISDKKKEIFHLSLGISPLYRFHEEIADASAHPAIVAEVLELALEPAFVEAVTGAIEGQAEAARRELRDAVVEIWS